MGVLQTPTSLRRALQRPGLERLVICPVCIPMEIASINPIIYAEL